MTSNQNFADLANEYIFSVYVLVTGIKTYCQETPHNNITSHQTVAQSGYTVLGRAANRLVCEVVQSRRRPLLGPSPG